MLSDSYFAIKLEISKRKITQRYLENVQIFVD